MQKSDTLTQIIATAHGIHKHLHDLPALRRGEVHFRPATNGVTMVGLAHERPQRGKSGYVADVLKVTFDAEYTKHCINIDQGRPTPEKQLQSHLIGNAYQHNFQMQALQAYLPESEDTRLIFVTDEISLHHEGQKIVCDILALNRTSAGDVPVLMELKSERAMKRLIEQLHNYVAVMNAYKPQYEALYSALLGESITFSAPPEKWLVWTSPNITQPDRRERELYELGIRTVGYENNDRDFHFHVGRKP